MRILGLFFHDLVQLYRATHSRPLVRRFRLTDDDRTCDTDNPDNNNTPRTQP